MTAQPSTHTVKAFDEDLEQLRATVAELGGWAEAAIAAAIRALCRFEAEAAAEAVALDVRIGALGEEVERRGICLIALRAPMADDLREVVAALKISDLIQRSGGHARNIARRLPAVAAQRRVVMPATLTRLAATAVESLRCALDAFAARDPEAHGPIHAASGQAEAAYDSLYRSSMATMIADPEGSAAATNLLFAAQSLAQVAAHSAAIAGLVHFAATGERPARAQLAAPDRIRAHG
ncbi:MAG TPA: PhoU domain-containing protein [Allosphingosinicella sp.]|nr:PhoU domain-containing protein [Allosphingosinicella sp.]